MNSKNDIFICPKDEKWYEDNPNGVADFWEAIREEKMAKGDYNFSKFVFPEFEEDDEFYETSTEYSMKDTNFWYKDTKLEFVEEVDFSGAIFTKEVYFA